MDKERVGKLIRMLSSPNEGEVLAAARALNKIDVHKVAALLEKTGDPLSLRDALNGFNASAAKWEIKGLKERLEAAGESYCFVCGRPFIARRKDAKTYSPRCRTKMHRL
jgi:hypothetical protein